MGCVPRVAVQEGRALETRLLLKGYRAIENGLAGDAPVADARVVLRPRARVQRVAAHAGDEHGVEVALIARVQRPEHVVRVEDVHILVHQHHVLQLREGREGQQRRLPLPPLVGGGLLHIWRMGALLWVRALTFSSQHSELATPL